MTPEQWHALMQCVNDGNGYTFQQCSDMYTYWSHGGP